MKSLILVAVLLSASFALGQKTMTVCELKAISNDPKQSVPFQGTVVKVTGIVDGYFETNDGETDLSLFALTDGKCSIDIDVNRKLGWHDGMTATVTGRTRVAIATGDLVIDVIN